MKVELKKVRFNERMSEETNCFIADLVLDGKGRGVVSNRGTGGGNEYSDHAAERELHAYAKTLPHVDIGEGMTVPYDADLLVDEVLAAWLKADNEKRQKTVFRNKCRTKTLFLLKDTAPGSYVIIDQVYSPAMKELLTKTYGDALLEIINERFK